MKVSTYYSQKISVLSFLSILMVVYIHSYYVEAEEYQWSRWLQLIVSGLTSIAVPLFYTISGFFFFIGVERIEDCLPRIKKRVNSILIPYLIWNIVFVGWYYCLSLIPSTMPYVNSQILHYIDWKNPLDTLNFLFLKPVGFQLWFLRDLILFIAVSPLVYITISRLKWWSLVLTYIMTGWITRFWIDYFIFGGVIGLYYNLESTRIINRKIVYWSIVIFITFVIANVIFDSNMNFPKSIMNYISHISVAFGVIAIWGLYDLVIDTIPQKIIPSIVKLSGYSFFIYLFHEPVFNIIKKVMLIVFGKTESSLIICYMINPVIMCMLAIIIAKFIEQSMPMIYKTLVGGRMKIVNR